MYTARIFHGRRPLHRSIAQIDYQLSIVVGQFSRNLTKSAPLSRNPLQESHMAYGTERFATNLTSALGEGIGRRKYLFALLVQK